MKLAAIDIGSNAARLLIAEVVENGKAPPEFNKLNLVRVPLRLGFDVFEAGFISKNKINKVVETIKAYKHLLSIYEVQFLKACATSAMRDAKNAQDIIRKVKMETGIEIKVISGDEEASFIYENHIAENLAKDHSYLYIDVGGGSTELTLYHNQKVIAAKSFNIGTVRLLLDKVDKDEWEKLRDWTKKNTVGIKPLHAIGSGGNINKIFKMSKKDNKNLSYSKLKGIYEMLSSYTYQERMDVLGLKPDRADVIVHAAKIFITIMKTADIEDIFVPQIGLSDGIIHDLYDKAIK